MQKNSNRDADTGKTNENNDPAQSKVVWTIVAAGVAGVLAILFVSLFFPNLTERTKFFTTNALSVLVLDVIVVQAYIYSKQWDVMERQVRVAERNVKIAENAFYIGEAPYFGIANITYYWGPTNAQAGTKGGARPKVWITFLNGGKTPAWHFSAAPKLVSGDIPETGESFSLNAVRSRHSEVENAFYPSGTEKTIEYETGPILSGDAINAFLNGKSRLFLIIGIRYRDRGDVQTCRVLYRVFDPTLQEFCDYDAYREAQEKKTN